MCEETGVAILFTPSQDEIYPPGFSTYVTEEKLSEGLCGVSRPAYFRGVTTILTKLCNILEPDVIVFGQKNAQQAAVARKMVIDLNYNVAIEVLPTVREPGGLPWGSRNHRLSPGQREDAKVIPQALLAAQQLVEAGVRNVDRVVAEATHTLSQSRRVRIIYASVVDPTTMEPERQIVPGRSLLAIAVWVDEVRLIDNITL
jgi:pantoate--beta-alanine ligase